MIPHHHSLCMTLYLQIHFHSGLIHSAFFRSSLRFRLCLFPSILSKTYIFIGNGLPWAFGKVGKKQGFGIWQGTERNGGRYGTEGDGVGIQGVTTLEFSWCRRFGWLFEVEVVESEVEFAGDVDGIEAFEIDVGNLKRRLERKGLDIMIWNFEWIIWYFKQIF